MWYPFWYPFSPRLSFLFSPLLSVTKSTPILRLLSRRDISICKWTSTSEYSSASLVVQLQWIQCSVWPKLIAPFPNLVKVSTHWTISSGDIRYIQCSLTVCVSPKGCKVSLCQYSAFDIRYDKQIRFLLTMKVLRCNQNILFRYIHLNHVETNAKPPPTRVQKPINVSFFRVWKVFDMSINWPVVFLK